jgi:hypothetical protein
MNGYYTSETKHTADHHIRAVVAQVVAVAPLNTSWCLVVEGVRVSWVDNLSNRRVLSNVNVSTDLVSSGSSLRASCPSLSLGFVSISLSGLRVHLSPWALCPSLSPRALCPSLSLPGLRVHLSLSPRASCPSLSLPGLRVHLSLSPGFVSISLSGLRVHLSLQASCPSLPGLCVHLSPWALCPSLSLGFVSISPWASCPSLSPGFVSISPSASCSSLHLFWPTKSQVPPMLRFVDRCGSLGQAGSGSCCGLSIVGLFSVNGVLGPATAVGDTS